MEADEFKQEVALPNGAAIPILGFGTWQIEGEAAYQAVTQALEVGYRHIDTATVYRNQAEVGRALASSGIAREELFITTKVPADAKDARATLASSLEQLQTDFVDLWLIHWPPSRSQSRQLWQDMIALQAEGRVRTLGVSNYSVADIDDLTTSSGAVPAVNQIAWSPFLYDRAQASEHQQRHVVLEGYSPFQTSRLRDPVLAEIAAGHRVSPAQVILRWHVQHDVVVIPKSVHRERIVENFEIFDFSLEESEMDRLDALAGTR